VNNFIDLNENYLILNENVYNLQNNNTVNDAVENFNFIGNKKGRPMNDKNLIYDEVTNKIYDPEVDLNEYKKARK